MCRLYTPSRAGKPAWYVRICYRGRAPRGTRLKVTPHGRAPLAFCCQDSHPNMQEKLDAAGQLYELGLLPTPFRPYTTCND